MWLGPNRFRGGPTRTVRSVVSVALRTRCDVVIVHRRQRSNAVARHSPVAFDCYAIANLPMYPGAMSNAEESVHRKARLAVGNGFGFKAREA